MRILLRISMMSAVAVALASVLLAAPVAANCLARPDSDPWKYQQQGGQNLTGDGITIAMLDSPVVEGHPVFAAGPGRVSNATDQPADVAKTPAEAGKIGPHGTAVASVVHNTAPGADIVVYSPNKDAYSLTEDPLNLNPFSGFAEAISRAVDDGADILLYSGGLTGSSEILGSQFSEVEEAIKRAHNEGVLVIVSAGNSGSDDLFCGGGADSEDGLVNGLPVGEPLFPVEMPEVFVVGGVVQEGSDGDEAIWNLWDCSVEGDFVDAYAPSVRVEVAKLNGEMSTASGTSFAAPVWAGYAAMLLESNPDMPLAMLTEMMKSSVSSSKSFGDSAGRGFGVPEPSKLQQTIFEVENDMSAWGVIPRREISALNGPSPGWCFALPDEDGWMDSGFEVNLYRSNKNSLHVRGLGVQVSNNDEPQIGGPQPNFDSLSITTPAGTKLEIGNPAQNTGCSSSVGQTFATQSRYIYDVLAISRGTDPNGWCSYGAGVYTLTADLGSDGNQTTTFEIGEDVISTLCCETASSAVGISVGVEGSEAEIQAAALDDTTESSNRWPWIFGGLIGGISALSAAGYFWFRSIRPS